MRQLVAFLYLAGEELKAAPFWIFLIIVALVGPILVATNALTAKDIWENRPVLSEPATVEDFDVSVSATGFLGGDRYAAVLQFRTPETETPSDNYVSPIFAPGWRTQPSAWLLYASQFIDSPSSLFDFHRNLLPILMILIGILALPSRCKLSMLHRLLPCGRVGNYLVIAGALGIRVALIVATSCAFTAVALAATGGLSLPITGFIASYFGVIAVHALAFAFLGLAIRGVIRNLGAALMTGLACGIGVLPLVFAVQSNLYNKHFWQPALSEATANPLISFMRDLLIPPNAVLDRLILVQERIALGVLSGVSRSVVLGWSALALFLILWAFIAWMAFPRHVEDAS